jgi:hypothetical protein
MSGVILLLKHWRITAVLLLTLGWALSGYLAHHRGQELKDMRDTMQIQQNNFKTQLQLLEKARQDDKERSRFRTLQNRKFKMAEHQNLDLDPELRTAYERLRKRQAGRGSQPVFMPGAGSLSGNARNQ